MMYIGSLRTKKIIFTGGWEWKGSGEEAILYAERTAYKGRIPPAPV